VDLATVVGLLVGFSALVAGVFWTGGQPIRFVSLSSIFITIIGSYCALMVANPLSRVLGIMRYFRLTLRVPVYEEERIISQLVTFSEKARREGLLALEDDLEEVEDEFLRKGIQLVVDGTDPDIIKNILYNELNQIQTRHSIGINLFDDWSKLAPAFGMIGTLIGLITMLAQIEDKSAIGIGMSTALITTLYGAVLGYLVFLPVKRKLEDRDEGESLVKEIMIEGILSIQSGDNPRILEEKLLAFLPPLRREAVRQEAVRE
jgi:chemotaxis protein MotA